MTTKEVAKILGQPNTRITNLVKDRKLKVKRLKSGYWYTNEDVERIRQEVERIDNLRKGKIEFLNLFWNEIKDDNKRKKVISNYATKFDIEFAAAQVAVNRFLLEESQRLCKSNKPRIETREDGTVVQVYQSKINQL
jgi:hypothetical protein